MHLILCVVSIFSQLFTITKNIYRLGFSSNRTKKSSAENRRAIMFQVFRDFKDFKDLRMNSYRTTLVALLPCFLMKIPLDGLATLTPCKL